MFRRTPSSDSGVAAIQPVSMQARNDEYEYETARDGGTHEAAALGT
ncbi:MAG: hypothetical protein ABEJ48_08105 [Halobacteriales archaeon]